MAPPSGLNPLAVGVGIQPLNSLIKDTQMGLNPLAVGVGIQLRKLRLER